MNHNEAVQSMAVERYLLDELSPESREAFEEHLFDCAECVLDLRAGAAFVDEAKVQLPDLAAAARTQRPVSPVKPASKQNNWLSWLRPAFAAPTFAVLLAVIAYQNLATIPSLRAASQTPRLLPWVSFHTGTRSAGQLNVSAGRNQGAVLLIELPQENAYASYAFELYDQQGKKFWTQTASVSEGAGMGSGTFSLMIPGAGLRQGTYTLAISGVTPQGARTEIDRRTLNIHFEE